MNVIWINYAVQITLGVIMKASATILFSFFFTNLCLATEQSSNGAYDVRIPTYDKNGRINWELFAEEADNLNNGVYSAKMPRMLILDEQRPATIAHSKSGLFDINQGHAQGTENLFVKGDGFEAIGKPWTFEENFASSRNRLAFSERGKIGFEEEIESGFVNGQGQYYEEGSSKRSNPLRQPNDENITDEEFSKDFPTTAYGKKIDLLDLGDGRRKFILEGDVFIEMLDLETNSSIPHYSTISCDWAELLLGKDGNTTAESFGQISKIHARGNVKLIQPLRKSSAGELNWVEESGRVYLFNNAKVFHQQWGEAQGEEIIVYEKDGRAEVIGGSEGRSRLILPPLGKSEKP
jgi:hypothetical protein